MEVRGLWLGLFLFSASVQTAYAADPIEAFLESPNYLEWERFVEDQRKAMEADQGRDQLALRLVELSSILLALDQREEAFRLLDRATNVMTDFATAEKNKATKAFRKEESKEWKGEGYERMAAFLYLSILYVQRGELGNGLAMSKQAALADAGTSAERYRGDFIPAYAMQAWLYNHFREPDNVQQAQRKIREALTTRELLDTIGEVRPTALGQLDSARYGFIEDIVLDGLSFSIETYPDRPAAALYDGIKRAKSRVVEELKIKRKDRQGLYRRLDEGSLGRFPVVQAQWLAALEDAVEPGLQAAEHRIEVVEGQFASTANTVFLIEEGDGPRKREMAREGARLGYDVDLDVPTKVEARIDGTPIVLPRFGSLGYQASTRGVRTMDVINENKAKVKQAAKGGLKVLSSMLSGPAGGEILSDAATSLVDATMDTSADTRGWRNLPDAFFFTMAELEPGVHRLEVGSRVVDFVVGDQPAAVHVPARFAGRAIADVGPGADPREVLQPLYDRAVRAYFATRNAETNDETTCMLWREQVGDLPPQSVMAALRAAPAETVPSSDLSVLAARVDVCQ